MVDRYFFEKLLAPPPSHSFFFTFLLGWLLILFIYLGSYLHTFLLRNDWMCVLELSSLILWLLLYLCKLGHVPAPQFVNSSLKILDMFFSLQFWSVQSIFCVMFFLFSNSTFVSSESAVSNNSFHPVHSKHPWQIYFLFWDGKNVIYCICLHDLLVL